MGELVLLSRKWFDAQDKGVIKFASVAAVADMLPGLSGQSAGRALTLSGFAFTVFAVILIVRSFQSHFIKMATCMGEAVI